MTDGAGKGRGPTSAGPAPILVAWFAAALFLGVLALLATRVSAGQDPALRARAAAVAPPPRRVLVRRIYERRVIVHLPATAPPHASQSSQQVSAGGSYPLGPVVTRTS